MRTLNKSHNNNRVSHDPESEPEWHYFSSDPADELPKYQRHLVASRIFNSVLYVYVCFITSHGQTRGIQGNLAFSKSGDEARGAHLKQLRCLCYQVFSYFLLLVIRGTINRFVPSCLIWTVRWFPFPDFSSKSVQREDGICVCYFLHNTSVD